MPATWTRDLPPATASSVKPSCAPSATRPYGRRSWSGAFAWSGSGTCRPSWRLPRSRRAQRDRRDVGLQGREFPRRRRSLLGVHAIRPGAAPAGMRRVLAGAVPSPGRSRGRDAHALRLLRTAAAFRARGEGAALRSRSWTGRRPRRLAFCRRGMVRRGTRAAAGGPVAELPLRDRPPPACVRPAHGARRHRPGPAAVLDQHGSAHRGASRLLPDHRRNGGDALGPLLRLRPAVAPHPAAGVSRSLALHVRSPRRGVHDRLELVDDRLAQGDRERQDSAAREHQAGGVPRVRRAAGAHQPAARARPVHGRARRGGSHPAHGERLAGASLERRGRQPRGLSLLHPTLARRVQLRQGVVHGVPERLGERSDAVLPGERQAGSRAAHRAELLSPERRRHVPFHLARRRRCRAGRDQSRLRAALPRRAGFGGDAVRFEPGPGGHTEHHADGEGDRTVIPIIPLLLLQSASIQPARVPDPIGPVTVVRVAAGARPVLDGRLNEPAWAAATPITQLIQRDPNEGAPSTEATEVRVLYDADALYLGARLFDSAPRDIIARLGRRDVNTNSDELRVLLDSYHDRRTAFEFIVNAAGVKRDALLGDDGGYSDDLWDAVWEAATAVDSLGWTVEMRIPLSQLRFSGARQQVWGVQVERWIQRKNELDMFPLVKKTESGVASRFADLAGLEDLPAPKRVELRPYLVGHSQYDTPEHPDNPFDRGSRYLGGAGADLKYGVTSNLTLDATVNPDFGQVELDPAIVNLTQFEVKLEEKRPFFVEGGNIFGFAGNGGGFAKLGDRPQFFYSRRIGQPPQGDAPGDYVDMPSNSTILGAAKLSGRRANGWSIGVLDALTAREWATSAFDSEPALRQRDEVEPLTNYFVGRVKRDLRQGNTTLGLVATAANRDPDTPALDMLGSAAYAGGVDLFHRWGHKTYTLAASLGGSYIRGSPLAIQQAQQSSARYYGRPDAKSFHYDSLRTSLAGITGDAYLNRVGGAWTWSVGGEFVSPGFEVNDLGFQERVDRISAAAVGRRRWTRPGKVFQHAVLELSLGRGWNYDGDL